MTSRWPTCSKWGRLATCGPIVNRSIRAQPGRMSATLLLVFVAIPLPASTVSGKVELRDSREASVRKRLDYSGVVIALLPVNKPANHTADIHVRMLQKNKMFTPHILAIASGTFVDFPNDDPIFHSAFSSYDAQIFDVGLYAPGSSKSVQFTRPGIVRVFCNIHSSMSAVIVVLSTPYFSTTVRDGTFQIPNVPPGDYQLTVFHERATEATLNALVRRVIVEQAALALSPIVISEAGFLQMPHNNKYGRVYAPQSDDHSIYPAAKKE
jgi:plastocyanin